MTSGKVSVIMPCYNAAKYLDEAIDSLRRQTYQNLEILAVNDGSKDDTQARLEAQAARDSRVRVFAQPNAGPSAARNTAIRNVDGEYVCFLDADDVYLPDKIERQVQYLKDHPDIDLVYSDWYTGDEQLNLTALSAVRIPYSNMVEAFAIRNWFPPLVPLFRRGMLDAVGEFDEAFRMTEDWEYWIRCTRAGKFAYLPGPLVIYRTHGAQAHLQVTKMLIAGKRVLSKHFRSDRVLHQRALASWYEIHAKVRWAAGERMQTARMLAFAFLHSRMAGFAQHLGGGSGPGKPPRIHAVARRAMKMLRP